MKKSKTLCAMIVHAILFSLILQFFSPIIYASSDTGQTDTYDPGILNLKVVKHDLEGITWELTVNPSGKILKEQRLALTLGEGLLPGKAVEHTEGFRLTKTENKEKPDEFLSYLSPVESLKEGQPDKENERTYILHLSGNDRPETFVFTTNYENDSQVAFTNKITLNLEDETYETEETIVVQSRERRDITGQINWEGLNQEQFPPDTTLYLIDGNNNAVLDSLVVEPDTQEFRFENHLLYDEENEPVLYTVKQETLANFETTYFEGNIINKVIESAENLKDNEIQTNSDDAISDEEIQAVEEEVSNKGDQQKETDILLEEKEDEEVNETTPPLKEETSEVLKESTVKMQQNSVDLTAASEKDEEITALDSQQFQKSMDIVLVIDDSNSMNLNNRREIMRKDVSAFVDKLEQLSIDQQKDINIGIVVYGTSILKSVSLSDDFEGIKEALPEDREDYPSYGYTNTQWGLYEGNRLLQQGTSPNKLMILISDGIPTMSHRAGSAEKFYDFREYDGITPPAIRLSDFNYSKEGILGGGTSFKLNPSYTVDSHIVEDHGVGTLSQAQLVKEQGVQIYSIGAELTNQSQYDAEDKHAHTVLSNVASTPDHYLPAYTMKELQDELKYVFNEIENTLSATLTVNKIYTQSQFVTGHARPGEYIQVILPDGGTRKGQADLKGSFQIPIPQQKAGDILKMVATDKSGAMISSPQMAVVKSEGAVDGENTREEDLPIITENLVQNRAPNALSYGDAFLWKTTVPAEIKDEFYIDIKTQGKDPYENDGLDIVLVIDDSNSMHERTGYRESTRAEKMHRSVTAFINELENDSFAKDKIKLGLIVYGTGIDKSIELTSEFSTVQNSIPKEYSREDGYPYYRNHPDGYTNTQLGLHEGNNLLQRGSSTNKLMIVISDGVPTVSYKAKEDSAEKFDGFREYGDAEAPEFMITDFDYDNRLGNGGSFWLDSGDNHIHERYYVSGFEVLHHGNGTMSEAQSIKNKGVRIVSIGAEIKEQYYTIVDRIHMVLSNLAADPDDYYRLDSMDEGHLKDLLQDIFTELQHSVHDGAITDPMGEMVELVQGANGMFDSSDYTLTASEPDLLNDIEVEYDSDTKTLKVEQINLRKGEWVNLRYKISLSTDDSEFIQGEWYPANGQAYLQPKMGYPEYKLYYPIPQIRSNVELGSLNIKKVDEETEKPLQKAEFKIVPVISDDSGEVTREIENYAQEGTTDVNGEILFDDLEPATYRIYEQRAPEGYEASLQNEFTEITIGKKTLHIEETITNKRLTGSLSITKVDGTQLNRVLQDAEFELQHPDGNVALDAGGNPLIGKTDSAGKIEWRGIPYGTYRLVETKPPENYEHSIEDLEILIDSENTKNNIVIENQPSMGNLEIIKVDGNTKKEAGTYGTFLFGAIFRLEHTDGKPVKLIESIRVAKQNNADLSELVTDENGRIFIKGLKPGEYQLVEVKAPPIQEENQDNESKGSYRLLTEPVKVTVTPQGSSDVYNQVVIENFQSDYVLPDTGGHGTLAFTLGGGILVTIAAALNYGERKKTNKRSD